MSRNSATSPTDRALVDPVSCPIGCVLIQFLPPRGAATTSTHFLRELTEPCGSFWRLVFTQPSMLARRRFIFRSASAQWFASDPENCSLPSSRPARRPRLDARLAQAIEIDGHALRRADKLERGQAPRPFDVLDSGVASIHGADGVHP